MLSDGVCSDRVRCIGLLTPFMSAGFKALQPLIFRTVRRPVVFGNLGRLICSLIDGLSVWSNYLEPGWEAWRLEAPLAGRYTQTGIDIKILTSLEVSDDFQKLHCPVGNGK